MYMYWFAARQGQKWPKWSVLTKFWAKWESDFASDFTPLQGMNYSLPRECILAYEIEMLKSIYAISENFFLKDGSSEN